MVSSRFVPRTQAWHPLLLRSQPQVFEEEREREALANLSPVSPHRGKMYGVFVTGWGKKSSRKDKKEEGSLLWDGSVEVGSESVQLLRWTTIVGFSPIVVISLLVGAWLNFALPNAGYSGVETGPSAQIYLLVTNETGAPTSAVSVSGSFYANCNSVGVEGHPLQQETTPQDGMVSPMVGVGCVACSIGNNTVVVLNWNSTYSLQFTTPVLYLSEKVLAVVEIPQGR